MAPEVKVATVSDPFEFPVFPFGEEGEGILNVGGTD
jgi:hypothetical protein